LFVPRFPYIFIACFGELVCAEKKTSVQYKRKLRTQITLKEQQRQAAAGKPICNYFNSFSNIGMAFR
jgi:hypothetical protein